MSAYNKKWQRQYYRKHRKRLKKQRRAYYQKNRKQLLKLMCACSKKRRLKIKIFLQRLKESTPCADCKKFFPFMCMDFDHIRGNKLGDVSDFRNKTMKSLMREIAKCEIVCANCHRVRTWKRIEK